MIAGGCRYGTFCVTVLSVCTACVMLIFHSPSWAVEGATAAGPIGGSDIRSAIVPPAGLYGGAVGLEYSFGELTNGTGNPAPGLDSVKVRNDIAALFLLYVPDLKVFGGQIGLFATEAAGYECGQLTHAIPQRCVTGFGDPYLEASWSRFFGQVRPATVSGAFPILQGVNVRVGIGAVLPIGSYNQQTQSQNGVTVGNNTRDVAPSVAVTYTTPPLIGDGTEVSARLYWNNYGTNSLTDYHASPLLDLDFAISEHIGRFQLGLAGTYLFQTGRDTQYGAVVPPDGRRFEYLDLGGVLNYDMAEYNASIRLKVVTTVISQNAPVAPLIVIISFAKKLY